MPTAALADVECRICGAVFQAPRAEIRRGHARYCSRACNGEATRRRLLATSASKLPNVACAQCGAQFYRAPSKVGRGKHGRDFCSRLCKDLAQSLAGSVPDIRPSHYGTATVRDRSDHYRAVAFGAHTKACNRCGWDAYANVLQVHHRNRDPLDDRPGNLEVLCPTCHEVEHYLRGDGRWSRGRPPNRVSEVSVHHSAYGFGLVPGARLLNVI
jgi:hypothetical protein